MKIALIAGGHLPIPPSGWGGVEHLIWNFSQQLKKIGDEVVIINTTNQNEIINKVNQGEHEAIDHGIYYNTYYPSNVVPAPGDVKDIIDPKLLYALYSPGVSLKPNHQDLVWELLVKISPMDILFIYWYDKEEFYKQYENWDESMKDWAIQTIRNNF